MKAAVARLNAERCLEVLWFPSYCGLMVNELAVEEARFDLAEHKLSVALDPITHRALTRRVCTSMVSSTLLTPAVHFIRKVPGGPSPK